VPLRITKAGIGKKTCGRGRLNIFRWDKLLSEGVCKRSIPKADGKPSAEVDAKLEEKRKFAVT